MGSGFGKLNVEELVKIVKLAAWSGLGAGVVAFGASLTGALTNMDVGVYGALLVPVVVSVFATTKEFFSNNENKSVK